LTDRISCNIISYMKQSSRLSGVLHVLLHMAQRDTPTPSEDLARMMDTNPVVIRRIMSGLRDQGYVRSAKGHGGGWVLACDPATVTLRDIHAGLGAPPLFAFGNRSENPVCLVEQAVNAALGTALAEAEDMLLRRFGEVTLAALIADFHHRLGQHGAAP